jgi:hypothetical protein
VQKKKGQERALLRRAERHRAVVADGLDRAEDAEFDARDPPLKPAPSGS